MTYDTWQKMNFDLKKIFKYRFQILFDNGKIMALFVYFFSLWLEINNLPQISR